MSEIREINWSVFKVWIVIVNNFPLNNARQSIHIYESEYEAQKGLKGWEGKCKAYAVEVPLIQLLNTLTSGGEYSHLEWVFPPNPTK